MTDLFDAFPEVDDELLGNSEQLPSTELNAPSSVDNVGIANLLGSVEYSCLCGARHEALADQAPREIPCWKSDCAGPMVISRPCKTRAWHKPIVP